ncbi:MAG: hypothetical protein JXN60_02885 [Lentisphaerae bacterium]|nr:hypothetical protein [Lentisphaerota bacterium]
MSKFCGYIGKQLPCANLLSRMTERITCESPHFHAYVMEGDGYGFASITLSDSDEGKIFEDDRFAVVFDGFSNGEHARSPARFMASLSRQGMLQERLIELSGTFNVALFEKSTATLTLFNDRFGFKPAYYYHLPSRGFLFASDVRVLLASGLVEKAIDWDSWGEYFAFRYLLQDHTYFSGVRAFEQAMILSVRAEETCFSRKQYWHYDQLPEARSQTEPEIVAEGVQVFENTIKNMPVRENMVCLLTGGFDSRLAVFGIKKIHPALPLSTYTSYMHPCGSADVPLARRVAQKCGFPHRAMDVDDAPYARNYLLKIWLTDGMSQEAMWSLNVRNYFRRHSDRPVYNIDGFEGVVVQGSDQMFPIDCSTEDGRKALARQIIQTRTYHGGFLKPYFQGDVYRKIAGESLDRLEQQVKEWCKPSYRDNASQFFFLNNRGRRCISLVSEGVFGGVMEFFAPYVDAEFMRWAFSIPPELKRDYSIYRKLLLAVDPDMLSIPTTHDDVGTVRNTLFGALHSFLVTMGMLPRVKSFVKHRLLKERICQTDAAFLKNLCDLFEYPEYFNRKYFVVMSRSAFAKGYTTPGIMAVMDFLTWYNLFMVENPKITQLIFQETE